MSKVWMHTTVFAGLFGVAVFLVTLLPGSAQARDCAAIIYEHTNYTGAAQCLQTGSYNVRDLEIGNDTLSSLKVSSGYSVILYEHSNYSGRRMTVRSDMPSVGGDWNDIVSSIIVE